MRLALIRVGLGVAMGFGWAHTMLAQERQLPADQRAYQAAMAQVDASARLTALRAFSVQYGDSAYFDDVQEAALTLLLQVYPARLADIRDQVRVNVANAQGGLPRLKEESREADALAEAGVLLPLAHSLAGDAVRNLTDAAYTRGMARTFGELQVELPAPAVLHSGYAEARATALLALAHVYLREGHATQASALLNQATTLQPRSPQLYALRGQAALAMQNSSAALAAFEGAAVLGALSAADNAAMHRLYQQAHASKPDPTGALQAELDQLWGELNPAPLDAETRAAAVPSAHAVLLELFTGAGCLPCAGADVAAEALFTSYGAGNVVLLEWDEHVPVPDPLANAASAARADVFGVGNTPAFFLDGKRMEVFGGTRAEAPAIFASLRKLVAVQAARSSGITLQLTATRDSSNRVQAHARVTSAAMESLQTATSDEMAPWPGDSLSVAALAHEQGGQPVAPVLNFVLVENRVRYSGENGVRFHSMVVRATSSAPAFGDALHPGTAETLAATFDTTAIQQALQRYLAAFEKGNDRFGPVQFASTDVTLQPANLGVVAFVQDTRTHRVLQAAYATVPPPLEHTP